MRNALLLLWLSAGLLAPAFALAQTGPFNPGANPISNQSPNFSVAVISATHTPTRAVYNQASSACSITMQPAGGAAGATVQFQNVQPGEFLPVQETSITATSCSPNPIECY